VTLRLSTLGGDVDWFVLAPAADVPAIVTSATPAAPDLSVRRDQALGWTMEDFSTKVVTSSIKVWFNGADVTAQASVAKAGDITTVSYDPPGLLDIGTSYPFEMYFSDDAVPANWTTNKGTLLAHYLPGTPAGNFVIEVEDFNYDGGQTKPEASVMPYLGGAYTNLSAVMNIDYLRGDNEQNAGAQQYRIGETNNVPIGGQNNETNTLDVIRAQDGAGATTWQQTVNFGIGWGGGGQWYNYTRTIPANTYQVWLGGSYDGRGANQVAGFLEKVTSAVTTTNQTVEYLGHFRSPGSGGWGNNTLVPLINTNTLAITTVSLSGQTTLRYNNQSGDIDYLMLIPTGAAQPQIDSISVNASGQVVISWTGAGTVQKTGALPTTGGATWSDVPGASPLTVPPPASGVEYYRLKQ
jgi:hypothetical protein